jgi:8-oxo-dGTP diphosphatase
MNTPATVYLVRHAKAGERRVWDRADEERPLSKTGWKQARAVADRLESKHTTRLVSSAYVRCVQTLEPLGEISSTEVEVDERLSEGGDFEPVLELLNEVPDGAVLCSHGDIIPAVIEALRRRGMELQAEPDWRKGTIWVLKRKNSKVTKGKVWSPSRR